MKKTMILAAAAAFCLLIQPAFAGGDLFSKICKDGDGKISQAEWNAYYAQFKEICKDGDTEITREEWNEYQAIEKGNAH